MLFTGDAGKTVMKKIEANKDHKVEMRKAYKYIKLPHHGTKGYNSSNVFCFSKYNLDIVMIPNGKRGDVESCKINEDYAEIIQELKKKTDKPLKIYCSKLNWCENNRECNVRGCACGADEVRIVFPHSYIEVS